MLHYFKFRQELAGPVPARDVYLKRGPGKGWPEECPPIRAANAFGFDLLANFGVTFVRTRPKGGKRAGKSGTAGEADAPWRVEDDIVIESDFDWAPHHHDTGTEADDAG